MLTEVHMHIDFEVENNDKDPKFKVGDCLSIPKFNNTSPKLCCYTKCSEEVF